MSLSQPMLEKLFAPVLNFLFNQTNQFPTNRERCPLSNEYLKKQFVGNLPTNCLSVFDHFVKLVLKELSNSRSHGLIN